MNDLNVLDLNKNNGGYKIDETLTLFVKNVKLLKLYVKLMQRGEYQQEWTEYFQQWKQQLQDRLHHVPEPPERTDIRHNIVMYALNERGPVMPEDENKIVYQIYPSVSHLDQGKKKVRWPTKKLLFKKSWTVVISESFATKIKLRTGQETLTDRTAIL